MLDAGSAVVAVMAVVNRHRTLECGDLSPLSFSYASIPQPLPQQHWYHPAVERLLLLRRYRQHRNYQNPVSSIRLETAVTNNIGTTSIP
ncbi:MAG TPA: hypothetical protein QF520_07195, partial [SAR202 cluster bacterium]|nr:hypothetical protein [SAR202 cluster bacterium]